MTGSRIVAKVREIFRAPRELAEAMEAGVVAGLEEFAEKWEERRRTTLNAVRSAAHARAVLDSPILTGGLCNGQQVWTGVALVETYNKVRLPSEMSVGELHVALPHLPADVAVSSVQIVFEAGEVCETTVSGPGGPWLLLNDQVV